MPHKQKNYVDKFKVPKILEYSVVSLKGLPRNWEKPTEALLKSPKSLVELTSAVLDNLPKPRCIYWKTPQVLNWLENTVQLPQYKETFKVNFVIGKSLILIGPNHLIKMNIHLWDDIKKIMNAIRTLYGGLPMPKFAKDLSKPTLNGTEYDWYTLYYRHIALQSPHRASKPSEYWRQAKLISSRQEMSCHWYSIATEQDTMGKIIVGRVEKDEKRKRFFVPMFQENHFAPTTIYVHYLDGDPLGW